MKTILIILLSVIASTSFTQEYYFNWVKSIIGGNSSNANIVKMINDQDGNLIFIGDYGGNLYPTRDSSTMAPYPTNSVNADVFIAKFDSNGEFLWVKTINSSLQDVKAVDAAIDENGNIIVLGYFYTSADFDSDNVGQQVLNTTSIKDYYIAKYNNDGNFILAKNFNAPNNPSHFWAYNLNVYNSDIIITGDFYNGTIDVDLGSGVTNMSTSSFRTFLIKYDLNLDLIWVKQFINTAQSSDNRFSSSAIDKDGNIVLVGTFIGSNDFDPGTASFVLTTSNNHAKYICKLDVDGNFLWAKFHLLRTDISSKIIFDNSNNIYISDIYYLNGSGSIQYSPFNYSWTCTSNCGSESFLIKLDNQGNGIWLNRYVSSGSNARAEIRELVLVNDTTLCLTGGFNKSLNINPNYTSINISPLSTINDGEDYLLVSLHTETGSPNWYKIIDNGGGTITNYPYRKGTQIVVDQNENIYTLSKSISFNSNTTDMNPDNGVFYLGSATMPKGQELHKYTLNDISLGYENILYKSNSIKLFPNPTNNRVNLSVLQGVQNTAVKIYSISGQEVLNIPITTLLENETLEIDITSLARGFYMVQINNTTQKLIVE